MQLIKGNLHCTYILTDICSDDRPRSGGVGWGVTLPFVEGVGTWRRPAVAWCDGVMPNMSHCEKKTRSTRFARDKWKLLNLTLTLTEEINKHLLTRLCEFAHAQRRGCELFGTASYDTTTALLTD